MIDIHAHILPGLDDGPESLEKAVAICTAAAVEGTTAIVATPHQRHESWENSDPVVLEAARATLQKAVGDSLTIALGGEVRWSFWMTSTGRVVAASRHWRAHATCSSSQA